MLLSDSKRTSSFMRKTLILIPTKEQFDKITPDPQQISPSFSKHTDSQSYLNEKPINHEDIVVPRNGPLPQQLLIKYPPKFPKPVEYHGYFRLRSQHNLPNPERYDLTQSDIQFIKQLKKQYNFNKKYKFESKTFIAIIESLQLNFHKLKTIHLDWQAEKYLEHLNFSIPIDLASKINAKQRETLKKMTIEIIDYWKKQKVIRKSFPLVRLYWPKTDIAISKYSFWVPYKTRIIEQSNKKITPVKVTKNFGNTEKQKALNKQVKEANTFFAQVKDIAETQSSQHARFMKEASKFHKLAQKYGFKVPQKLTDVIVKKPHPQYMKILQKMEKSVYFSNPIVKMVSKSRFVYRPAFERVYEIAYDGESKLIDFKTSENSTNEYEIESENVWSYSNEQNKLISNIKARHARTHSFYHQKKKNGHKRVKIQQ